MKDNCLIDLKNISHNYMIGSQKISALSNINLKIMEKDFILVTGPSGSGKSTLLNIIAGIEQPELGTISFKGENLYKMNDYQLSEIRKKKIGFIFQFFNLHPLLTVYENIELPMIISDIDYSKRENKIIELLNKVDLSDRKHHFPHELSGGEKQRVGIARALANDPDLLLADEPTGDLDAETTDKIFSLIHDLNKENGKTIIYVTHDTKMIKEGLRQIKISDGKIIKDEKVLK